MTQILLMLIEQNVLKLKFNCLLIYLVEAFKVVNCSSMLKLKNI